MKNKKSRLELNETGLPLQMRLKIIWDWRNERVKA